MIHTPQLWLPDRLRQRREDERLMRGRGGLSRRWMPGYPCCCGFNCELFTDAFDRAEVGDDWSVASGNWSIIDETLVSEDANAKVCHTATLPKAIVVMVDVEPVAGSVIRIWTNDTDYAECECLASGGNLFLRVRIRDGQWSAYSSSFAAETVLAVKVCHTTGSIKVEARSKTASGAPTKAPDTVCLAYGSTAESPFHKIEIYHHDESRAGCPSCRDDCVPCEDGWAPEAMLVEIAGVVDGDGGDDLCLDADCDGTNGAYVVGLEDTFFDAFSNRWICRYRYFDSFWSAAKSRWIHTMVVVEFLGSNTTPRTYWISGSVSVSANTGEYWTSPGWVAQCGYGNYATEATEDLIDCANLNDVELPQTSSVDSHCEFSGASFTVTSLP